MRDTDRKTARDMIANKGYKEVGIIHEMPGPLFWGKEVEILYEDMDGRLCECRAKDVAPGPFNSEYFIATNGPAKGNHMANVVAWRPLKEEAEK